MKAYIIHHSGQVATRELDPSKDFETCQGLVEGYVEVVSVLVNKKPSTMYVNEDGIAQGLPVNARATAIYWTATIQGVTGTPFDPLRDPLIHGTVVLFPVDKRRL